MRLLLIFAYIIHAATASAPLLSNQRTEIENALHRLEPYGLNGIVAYQKGDEPVHVLPIGLRDMQAKLPVDHDSLFDIASVTKHVTALAIYQLLDQGALALSDTLATYYEDLPAAVGEIRIEQLLNHTSGLVKDPKNIPSGVYGLAEQLAALLKDMKLGSAPGEKFRYSNLGYCILGDIIGRGRGGYQRYIDRAILRPLGLQPRFYDPTRTRDTDFVRGYERQGDDNSVDPYDYSELPLYECGASGLILTGEEVLTLVRATLATDGYFSANLSRRTSAHGVAAEQRSPYAAGLRVSTETLGTAYWHDGDTSGHEVKLMHFPHENLTLFIAINNRGGWRGLVYSIMQNLLRGEELDLPPASAVCQACKGLLELQDIDLLFDGAPQIGMKAQPFEDNFYYDVPSKEDYSKIRWNHSTVSGALLLAFSSDEAERAALLKDALPDGQDPIKRFRELKAALALDANARMTKGITPWRRGIYQSFVRFEEEGENMQLRQDTARGLRFVWHPKTLKLLFFGAWNDPYMARIPFAPITEDTLAYIDVRNAVYRTMNYSRRTRTFDLGPWIPMMPQ